MSSPAVDGKSGSSKVGSRMVVNGFRAEVLSEKFFALMRKAGEKSWTTLHDAARAPSRQQREQFLADADTEGLDEVVVERHLYVKYSLRTVMTSRSGSLVYVTTFRKDAAGKWVSKRSTRRDIH